MNCRHEWEPHPPSEERLANDVTTTTTYAGVRCRHCKHPRGGPPSPVARTYRTQGGPRGPVPSDIAVLLSQGRAEFRHPQSSALHDQAVALALAGAVDIDTEYNAHAGTWATRRLWAPAGSDQTTPLDQLRTRLMSELNNQGWLATASTADLELVAAVLQDSAWKSRRWPGRVWTAHLRGHSKSGDASYIAERLGLTVPRRGHEVWFYGQGKVSGVREFVVDGETCISSSQLGDISQVHADHLWVIENRDLASIMPGFVLAVDGNLKPGHESVVRAAVASGIPVTAWFDMDAEGIGMARRAHSLGLKVTGFGAFPPELGWPLDSEKRLYLAAEEAKRGPFAEALTHIRHHNRYWEQERIYAAAQMAGQTIEKFVAERPFP